MIHPKGCDKGYMTIRKNRRSILHDTPNRWVGWRYIQSLYDHACEMDEGNDRATHSLYFITLFETGGRKEEVILLRPDQIESNEEIIKINNMEVLKWRRRHTRNVFIKIEDNPLAQTFLDHVSKCNTRYLLPGYSGPFSTEIDPNKHVSLSHVYNKIVEIDPEIWPHWLRDQRSWHLSADIEQGGREFDIYLLKEWFQWASIEMPSHYAGRREERDILDHFGVEDIKTVKSLPT